jgi:hypothetical protein
MASFWDQNPYADAEAREWLAGLRARVDGLTSRAAIRSWMDDALEGGIDPL